MTSKPALPSALIDCTSTGDNELVLVEGLSAANAIKSVRSRQQHAILPMQGKVPNANRISEKRLFAHPKIADLLQSLHPQRLVSNSMDCCRYQRIVILSDPDADGVHASILLLSFISQYLSALVNEGRLYWVRAPLYGFYRSDECIATAFSEQHAASVLAGLSAGGISTPEKRRYKGIASLDANQRQLLLAPDYPTRRKVSLDDCREICEALP